MPTLPLRALLVAAVITGSSCRPTAPAPFDEGAFFDPLDEGPWGVLAEAVGTSTLFVPTADGAASGAPARAPLVVVLPGFSSGPADLEESARFFATHGLAALAVDHGFGIPSALGCATQADGKARARAVVEDVRRRGRTRGDPLFDVVDGARLLTFGHSYGGKLAVWLALEDDTVAAVVALDPVDGADERRPAYCPSASGGFPEIAPRSDDLDGRPLLLFLAGRSGECAPAGENAEKFFAASAAPASLVTMPDATHTDFLDAAGTDACPACGLCPETATEPALVRRYVRARTVALAKDVLERDGRYAALRDGDGALAAEPFSTLVVEAARP